MATKTYTIKKLVFEQVDNKHGNRFRAVSPFCIFEILVRRDGKFSAFAEEGDDEYLIGVSNSFGLAEKAANEHLRMLLASCLNEVEFADF